MVKTTLGAFRGRQFDGDAFEDVTMLAGILATTPNRAEAVMKAKANGAADRVVRILEKAAQSGGTIGNTGPTDFGPSLGVLADALKASVFDTIAGSAFKVPGGFVGRVAIASNVSAGKVDEGVGKPIRRLQMSAVDFDPIKIVSQVVISSELADGLSTEGLTALGRELRSSVAVGTDSEFLAALAGETAEAMGADSWAGWLEDFEELLRLVNLTASSRPYLILPPELGKAVAVQALVNGVDSIRWNGGSLAGVEILVSDAQGANKATLVDASSIAIVDSGISLKSSTETTVQMDTAPNMTSGSSVQAASVVSLFQTNSRCVQAERSISVKAFRPNAFAHLTNVALAEDSGSPALA